MNEEIMERDMFKKIILLSLMLILQPASMFCMKESNKKYIGVYLISSLKDKIIKLKNDIEIKSRELERISKLKKNLSIEIENLKKEKN